MLTPEKIHKFIKAIARKHTEPQYGLYPPQKKIVDYILRQVGYIQANSNLDELQKVEEMTNLLEGFIRYLNGTSKILKLDVEKILTYIYYPEGEETTLENKDNLMIGSKAETVRLWHDAYYNSNKGPIINRLIDCKNVLYNKINMSEHMKLPGRGMPQSMHQKYQEMLQSNLTIQLSKNRA